MMQFARGAFGVVLLALLSETAVAADFGRTPGGFQVSDSGAATYQVPIWTPPGPNGVQPNISLSYDSQSGNGVAGVGWHVSAVSSIARCARTKHQDGSAAAVELTSNDRYCIGGNRLRLASGTYGMAGSVYHTELADYSRITAFGTAGNGPQYFIVEAKSGLKYEYGATTSSRVFAGISPTIATTPHRWMLNKVYDRNGNNYVISYNNLNGFAVPDVISWTPTSYGAGTYRYEAKFNYSTRTDVDSFIGKEVGFDVANRYRLENIQIKSAGVVKRKYRLGYNVSSITSRSRLTSAKECADDAETNCLLPIAFTYQTGVTGLTAGAGPAPSGSSNGLIIGRYDFNGDGKDDLLYMSGATCHVAFGLNTGFSAGYSTGLSSCGGGAGVIDRFLPNGRDAIATLNGSSVLLITRWDDATSSFVSENTGVVTTLGFSADYDNDGLADLSTSNGGTSISMRRNTSSGTGTVSFSSTTTVTASLSAYGAGANYAYIRNYFGKGIRKADINGDGRQDVSAVILIPIFNGQGQQTGVANYTTVLLGATNGFLLPPQVNWTGGAIDWPAIRFNSDGCTDRLGVSTIYISACNGVAATTITAPATPLQVLDWDGDGKTDILVNSGGNFAAYLSTGTGFTGPYSTTISSTGTFFPIDQDGDNQEDLVKVNGTSAIDYWTHTAAGAAPTSYAPNIPDLLASVTDGFGVVQSVGYISTSWGNYSQGALTYYPLQRTVPMVVVAQLTNSNGIGGTFNKTFYYVGARSHAERGSFIGFQRIDETDSRNGVIERKYFEQTFPVAGMLSQIERMQPNGTTPISRTVFTNTFATLDSTANNQRYFTYSSGSTTTQYEVAGTWNGALLRTMTTSNIFDTASGTLYDQTTTTTEPSSGANGLNAGGSWVERTYTPLANLLNNTTTWCLGRPEKVQRINSHNLAYGTSITRTTDMTWNTTYCRPTQVTDEQGSSTLEVVTAIGYDSFGNVNSQSVTGAGMTARTSTMSYSDATFTTGQFMLSTTNALSQTSKVAWNYDLGVPISATDPNDISVSWQYDAFGRRTREDRADGTATTWSINDCALVAGGCYGANNKTTVIETAYASGGTYVNDVLTYIDAFDRPTITSTRTAGGSYNRLDREFDALGRVYRESAPCLGMTCTPFWTTNTYDLVNRAISVARPISDSNATLQTSYFYFEGLRTRIVDAQSKQMTRAFSAKGQLYRSIDHDGYYQTFDYDAFGSPKRVQDSSSNVLQTSTYNLRGMLTQRVDMDMGTWNFTPNALGETVSQTDAKSQTTTFAFDLLGRLTSRNEAEGLSTWTWGASSSDKNIGRLDSVSGPGYSEDFTYDSLGRPSNTAITADMTTYQIDFTYNSIGLVDTLTYPTSTSSYRLKLQYEYQNGHLFRIKDFNAPTTVFWTLNAVNAANQITQQTLGNGVVTNRAYDAVTGLLKTIQSGVGGGTGVQNLAYTWDLVGNLSSRKDVNQSNLTETFYYDNLYRLDYSQLNGITNLDLSYNSLGNISTKSDVGTYTYHASRKHLVVSTNNGWSFAYDNNGNMTSGRGGTATWTSYNYPSQISNAGLTSDFNYTPDRQYFKQVATFSTGTATTIYIGGILEKVTTTAGTDYRHMIRAGGSTIVVSRQVSGTNSTHYVTSDHIGSSSAITNGSGGILVNSSFDAYGKRRGANWMGSPSAGDWTAIASTTRRGYTDHSMLDNLNLIHMNGRAQDPVLGRFMSADPYIPDPTNTQSFNRLSYVRNNPLSLVDPSGFEDIFCYIFNSDTQPSSSDADYRYIRGNEWWKCFSAEPRMSPPLVIRVSDYANPTRNASPDGGKPPQGEPTVCTRPSLGEAKISLGAQLGFSARLPGRAVTINGDINLYSWSQSSNEHFARVGQSFGGGFSLFGFGPNAKTERSVPAVGDFSLSRASFSDTQYGADLQTHMPGSNTELSTPEDNLNLAVGVKALVGLELRLNLLELVNRVAGIDSCN